ncbi:MAG: hypothetical protein U0326_26860 [Polyangiales bacterium]
MTSIEAPRSTRSRRRQRGAAYAETVVMLPFFIAVWSCIIYVHNAYAEKVKLMAKTRNCVMTYAYDACRTTPPGCTFSTGASGIEGPGEVDGFVGTLGSFGGGLLSAVTGASVSSRMTSSVSKPRVLGGGSTSVLAGASMQCNTRYQDNPVRSLASGFCSFIGIGC